VCGVAAKKNTPIAKAVRDETPTDPILLGNHFVAEVAIDAENRANRPVAIDGLGVFVFV
jgi:hypothetical protein